jgi:hypothetical protein
MTQAMHLPQITDSCEVSGNLTAADGGHPICRGVYQEMDGHSEPCKSRAVQVYQIHRHKVVDQCQSA